MTLTDLLAQPLVQIVLAFAVRDGVPAILRWRAARIRARAAATADKADDAVAEADAGALETVADKVAGTGTIIPLGRR